MRVTSREDINVDNMVDVVEDTILADAIRHAVVVIDEMKVLNTNVCLFFLPNVVMLKKRGKLKQKMKLRAKTKKEMNRILMMINNMHL